MSASWEDARGIVENRSGKSSEQLIREARGEAFRVDRLRADGWTKCPTCQGRGAMPCSFCNGSEPLGDGYYSDPSCGALDCPDCVSGLVPPDGMVEAAAFAIWFDVGRNEGRPPPAPYMQARAALLAAARWEQKQA